MACTFALTSLLLLLLLLEKGCTSPRPPNFVLIMVDDMGIGDLGCYGNKTLRTPNIDQLARDGVKLTHHIAAANLCTPSRAAFLTGRYPVRSGVAGLTRVGVFIFNAASGGLPSQETTFAKIAKQQGYETALIGKWHLGLNCDRRNDHCHHPSAHGFDYFFGIPLTNLRECQPGHGAVINFFRFLPYKELAIVLATAAVLHCSGVILIPRCMMWTALSLSLTAAGLLAGFMMIIPYANCVLMRGHAVVEQPFASDNLTQAMTKEAVDFIESNSERPFLLFFSFIQVHTALFASAAFRGTSRHGIYGDAIHEVDWSVGQLMDALERLHLRENTLVYFTSDQGAHLEETQHGSNGIYKAGKATNWEGGIRVPGIISWPGTIPGGAHVDEPTSNMDLFPTVVRLSGAELPGDREIDGRDLMDLLQGRVERSPHEFLFHYCNAYLNAVRWRPRSSRSVWKAFYFTPNFDAKNQTTCSSTQVCFCTPGHVTRHDPPLLFDLSKDPSEATPLTRDTEPAFEVVIAKMEEAVARHQRSLEPVESQFSVGNVIWKPWLQPCCSTLGQLCQCQNK